MQLGFAVPVAGSWATPDNQVALAQRAEALGYASIWTFQRLLFPADPDEAAGARWQPVYRSVHDPLMTLAFLAGQTSQARLGVAVLNMPWYSPILLAKMVTTLDHLSGGRVDVGLGLGWSPLEYAAAGAPYERRGERSDEFLACLTAIWTQDPVDFHGRFHDVGPAHVAPGPVQRPHPPVLLGGAAPAALRRAGRLTQGWISSSGQDLTDIASSIEVVRAAAREAGRDPGGLRFVCRGVVRVRDGSAGRSAGSGGSSGGSAGSSGGSAGSSGGSAGSSGGSDRRRPLTGTLEQIRADLAMLAEQGVDEVFVDLNFDSHIGSPEANPADSVARAHEVLGALAPAQGGGS